jgi:hypothetical protein
MIDYLIPYRHSIKNLNNLRKIIDWVKGFNTIRTTVIEVGKISQLKYLNLECNYLFLETKLKKTWNRSWAYNYGLSKTSNPIVIFGDINIISNPEVLISSFNELSKYDCILPFDSILQLDFINSNSSLQQIVNLDTTGKTYTGLDNISIFKRDAINKIGGWCEMLMDGDENDFQAHKMGKMLNFKQQNNTSFCFDKEDFHKQNNPELLKKLLNLGNLEIERYINAEQRGMANKFLY